MAIIFKNKPAAVQPAQTPLQALIDAVATNPPPPPPEAAQEPPAPAPDASTAPTTETQAPAAEAPMNLMAMALDDPPWEAPAKDYTILKALEDLRAGKFPKKTLFFLKNDSNLKWRVLGWDAETKRASLEGDHGMKIRPVITEREVPTYTPFWR